MAGKLMRCVFIAVLMFGAGSGVAWADVDSDSADNAQEGDNSSDTNQGGEAGSGDAVAGQVVGGVSSGDASIDATNLSEDTTAESGDVSGSNSAATFAGLTTGSETALTAEDVVSGSATNVQEGDNDVSVDQEANAMGGDGVGGQVIGAVTSAGGSLDIVAANTGGDGEGGGASADNSAAAFAGLNGGGSLGVSSADVTSATATNVQEGDNGFDAEQAANASGGDGVGGQVIGAVSSGDTSIDATNDGGEGEGGSASASNSAVGLAGHLDAPGVSESADVASLFAVNVQEGDNDVSAAQAADASGGDGVGGQVIGAVTSGGGSADIVAANTGGSGDGGSASASNTAVGLALLDAFSGAGDDTAADIFNASATNVQEGDNEASADQAAAATGGDGVGGQVLGAVSAGDTSIDATNEGGSGDGGSASASNSAIAFAGLEGASGTVTLADITNLSAANVQEGDNGASADQIANASGGDGVGGMVAGVVTSAGGSADLVLANTGGDAEAGSASMHNDTTSFTGLNAFGVIHVF